ncbi:MAG: hypothetical protein ACAI35_05310 [Candidatus Methylacidiphilales bacterium]
MNMAPASASRFGLLLGSIILLCVCILAGCATPSGPPKLNEQEVGIAGIWRSTSPSVPEYHKIILRRPDGTFIQRFIWDGKTMDGDEGRFAGTWRIVSGKQISYTTYKVWENGTWRAAQNKSFSKDEIVKMEAGRIDVTSKDGVPGTEIRIGEAGTAASESAFETMPVISR